MLYCTSVSHTLTASEHPVVMNELKVRWIKNPFVLVSNWNFNLALIELLILYGTGDLLLVLYLRKATVYPEFRLQFSRFESNWWSIILADIFLRSPDSFKINNGIVSKCTTLSPSHSPSLSVVRILQQMQMVQHFNPNRKATTCKIYADFWIISCRSYTSN
jgi:hypothetical protein